MIKTLSRFALVVVLPCLTSANALSRVWDLSHRPDVSAKALSNVLLTEDNIAVHQQSNFTTTYTDAIILPVVVDVSDSNLRDNGLNEFMNALTARLGNTCTAESPATRVRIDFRARMNEITAIGFTSLWERLKTELYADNTQQSNTTKEGLILSNSRQSPAATVDNLDLSWNQFYNNENEHSRIVRSFHTAMQDMISNQHGPSSLSLSCTGIRPSTCRALAKGLLTRWIGEDDDGVATTNQSSKDNGNLLPKNTATPISLYLSKNPDIGDAGTAALAAAIRYIVAESGNVTVIDTLDLSACGLSDVSAEALALAIENADVPPIRRLLLRHNHITNQGALSLGRAVQTIFSTNNNSAMVIDLSNNPKISDRGIATLLNAVEKGNLCELVLRSCSIHADGAELVGKTLRHWCSKNFQTGVVGSKMETASIDISGNPLGVLRGKSPSEKSSGYSTSYIKSKAAATASAYVTQGLSFLKKGLGGGVPGIGDVGGESDDEEEKQHTELIDQDSEEEKSDNKRCGFKAMANAFIGSGVSPNLQGPSLERINKSRPRKRMIRLGLRRTFCDTAGADALAAMAMFLNDEADTRLDFSLDLNPILEDDMLAALQEENSELLAEMSDRHSEAMAILRQAQERAIQATKQMSARRKASFAYDDDDNNFFDDTVIEFDNENDVAWNEENDDGF